MTMHKYFTCDVVGCQEKAEIMDQIEFPGRKGTFLRQVCKKHLQVIWDMFDCYPGER